jgi:hypothetical protein
MVKLADACYELQPQIQNPMLKHGAPGGKIGFYAPASTVGGILVV